MDELKYVAAAPFKRNEGSSMLPQDFEFSLSFDLKWMTPEQASRILDMVLNSHLLYMEDEHLHPAFDPSKVDIPRGFIPSKDILQQVTLVDQILEYIASCSNMELKQVVSLVNNRHENLSGMVDVEVAALITGRELGCDMDKFYEKVLQKVSING